MSRRQDSDHKLTELPNLFEITLTASHASFLTRSLFLALSYPAVPGQGQVLQRMAEVAADRSGAVHRALEAALGEIGEKP